ncbi:hypothetical protein JHK82_051000 [Glycine max]|nr:hypothetical protein JHK85_051701 [Glycine max]KAG5092222.1 hypothetical protein JHK82_051000 [Glycine max]
MKFMKLGSKLDALQADGNSIRLVPLVHKAVDACKNVLRGLHSNKITERELDKDNDFKSLMQDQENALYLVISQFWKQGFIFSEQDLLKHSDAETFSRTFYLGDIDHFGGETTKIDDAADVDVGPSDVVEPGDNEEYITEVLVA